VTNLTYTEILTSSFGQVPDALQAELRKAKRGTQAFADALVRANASLFKYEQANRGLAAARADVNTTAAGAKQSVTAQWRSAAMGSNSRTSQFLTDIQTIAGRGYPVLARELLALGEDEAGALARKAVSLDVRGLQQMTHEINTSARLEARRDDLTATLNGTKRTSTTNPVVQIRASDFTLTAARAAAAVIAGPQGANTMRPIPAATVPSLAPGGAGTRTMIGAETINVYETRSAAQTGQQVGAAITWAMGSWGGAAA